jgi:molybdate transport system permease protein
VAGPERLVTRGLLDVSVLVGDPTAPRMAASLTVSGATTVAVVGPNGAGKSTLLRAVAGLVPVSAHSHVRIDGEDVTGRPPAARHLGYVPQAAALFPHLSVRDNVAYGPRSRGAGRRAARQVADGWLQRLDIEALGARRPDTLSGGQAQRVALARALAVEPAVLLLDEPTSSLDAAGRDDVRRTLVAHLATFAGTALVVTHDATEALALADRVVVVEGGAVVQDASPDELLRSPQSAWTADLLGLNAWHGVAVADGEGAARVRVDGGGVLTVPQTPPPGQPVLACVASSAVTVSRDRPVGSARNVWPVTVSELAPVGHRLRVTMTSRSTPGVPQGEAGPSLVVAEITRAAATELALAPGAEVWAAVKAVEVAVTPL